MWVGFDPLESNWPLRVSFPIFIANAVDWLNPATAAAAQLSVHAGEAFRLPLTGEGTSPTNGVAPLEVQFTDTSNVGNLDVTAVLWDFGDGSFSTAALSVTSPSKSVLPSRSFTTACFLPSFSSSETVPSPSEAIECEEDFAPLPKLKENEWDEEERAPAAARSGSAEGFGPRAGGGMRPACISWI